MNSIQTKPKLRLLVAIASYGESHLDYLKNVIETYHKLPIEVDIVVLSEAPKNVGDGARVVVGLPSKNPWSLPFAHKKIFAEEAGNYDLFIYTEDDIAFTEQSLDAFLRVTPELAADELAGFLLYEKDQAGKVSLANFHAHFHWKPESAKRRGRHLIAEFTNEHSAFYLLTQAQLKRAIASGGFLRDPYEGRYDLLCTAATDPYTSCGFRKVICISEPDGFLLHHLPNRYVGKVGIPLEEFQRQVQALARIESGSLPAATLCPVETKLRHALWSKSYYEKPDEPLWKLVPREAKTVLSVGCGWGATELKLKQRGSGIAALPLDSVIGASAASQGIEIINGTLQAAIKSLAGRTFDCVFISGLLHLLPDPWEALEQCLPLVKDDGTIVIAGPNFERLPVRVKRLLGAGEYRKLRSYSESGIRPCGRAEVARRLGKLGWEISASLWFERTPHLGEARDFSTGMRRRLGGLLARDWVIQARRRGNG